MPLLVLGDATSTLRSALAPLRLPLLVSTSEGHALQIIAEHPVSMVIYAGSLKSVAGFLERLEKLQLDLPVLLLADAEEELATSAALQAGVSEVLLRPVDPEELRSAISRGLGRRPDREEKPPPSPVERAFHQGTSPAMRDVLRLVDRVAPSAVSVLLRGESGTGKEMIAREIHARSPRSKGPLVKVHCAAIPENLIESELFGHEKGAFTGAFRRKPGRLELAQGGTLFLDEIGEVPPSVQVKVLRFLQEREFERVGGTDTIRVDVRLIAATHRNLEEMIKQGTFREDLFYRLNVVPIWLPPLRARRDDIVALLEHFCARLAVHHGKPGLAFTPDALVLLRRERWPGNVRQLQNVVERLVVLAPGPAISAEDVREDLERAEMFATQAPTLTSLSSSVETGVAPGGQLADSLGVAERKAIKAALDKAQGNKTLAARLLGISRRTLYNKIELFGLS